MSLEANKAVVRRYYDDVLNRGDLQLLETLVRPDHIENDPLPGQGGGLPGIRKRVEMLREAFRPEFAVQQVVAEGDTVVVRWTHKGTHVGAFLGIPATQKSFTIAGIDVHRLEDGKLAEHWHVVDQLSLLQQLGIIPSGG